ncbi:MAG: 4-hydroxybenzoate polyprenyltransferase [Glaciecola sp.]|jgi:4-hydroxybenzoate polyprenyltransferase
MINFLNLIRWKNLLLIAFVQILIKYALLEPFEVVKFTLNDFGFGLLVLATLCIAAAGNVINDIYDVETDFVNKPNKVIVGNSISEKTAFNMYIVLTIIGIGVGFYLSNLIDRSGFSAIFVIISALLYIYATYLKQSLLVGNIVVSFLVAMSLLIVGLFELLPVITDQNQETQLTFFKIIFDYAIFAFMINLLREMIKDIEDINGDYKVEMKTLPIIIGRERALKIIFALSIVPLLAVIYYTITYLYRHYIVVGYFLIFIIAPLLYFTIKSFSAETKKEINFLSAFLKIIMLFGVMSLLLYPFILK